MSTNKEFLTDILEKVLAVHQFLNEGLSKERLTPGCDAQRKNALISLDTIAKKIQNSHPSVRPRVNTPGKLKKPVLAPPITNVKAPPPPPIEEDGELYEDPTAADEQNGELYEDPTAADEQASNYLSFYPASSDAIDATGGSGEEEEQEMYEAMEAGNQQQEDVAAEDDQAENYEDPVLSRPTNISSSSLPPPIQTPPPIIQPPAPPISQHISEGEYATTVGMGPSGGGNQLEASMSVDWDNVYTTPPKGEKRKVSSLKNVKIKGPLEKLGGRNHKNWQKRYCVLAGPLMYFYEKENSKTYNNYIVVTLFTASLTPKIADANKQYAFKLTQEDKNTGKHKDYYFRAVSSEIRDKWLSCIQNAEALPAGGHLLPSSAHHMSSVTLPRNLHSSQAAAPSSLSLPPIGERKRAQSVGDVQIEEEEGELYEDMAVTEEEDKIKEESDDNEEEYVDVQPGQNQQDKLSLSEEYVDVVPQNDVEQEEYEEPSMLQYQQQPAPPMSPPPGPPSEVFVPPPTQPKAASRNKNPYATGKTPAPLPPVPTEPEADTNKVYDNKDIPLEKVFVSQWDFAAGEPDELRLNRGDLVFVSKPLDSDVWWYGELLDADASRKLGPAGFFPKNYSTLAFEAVPT